MYKDELKSFKPETTHGMDIEHIIGAPLVAASTANSMMLREQTKFIMDFCFSKEGDIYHPVMIPLSISRAVIEKDENNNNEPRIKTVTTKFNLPLLTIVPISSLAVESVKVDFEMEITSEITKDAAESSVLDKNQSTKPKLLGRISTDSKDHSQSSSSIKSSSKSSSKLKVNINAEQLPLPVGLTTILELFTKSIQPLESDSNREKT